MGILFQFSRRILNLKYLAFIFSVSIALSIAYPSFSVGDTNDSITCADFLTQEDAQSVFDYGEFFPIVDGVQYTIKLTDDEVSSLDSDGDWLACEHLPHRAKLEVIPLSALVGTLTWRFLGRRNTKIDAELLFLQIAFLGPLTGLLSFFISSDGPRNITYNYVIISSFILNSLIILRDSRNSDNS